MEDADECYAVMLEARAGLTFVVLEAPAQDAQACIRSRSTRNSARLTSLTLLVLQKCIYDSVTAKQVLV